MIRGALLALGLATTLALPRATRAQEAAYRFEILTVGDSTFTFAVMRQSWIRRGMRGIAVDPRRRDALIARFRVLAVANGEATALVTGQTTAVGTEHMALLQRPKRSWYVQPLFWIGAVLGGVVGAVVAH